MTNYILGQRINGPLAMLYSKVHHYINTEAKSRLFLGGGDIVESTITNLANEIYTDILRNLSDHDVNELRNNNIKYEYHSYKQTHYNLNLLCSRYKVKVYLGINARVARENFIHVDRHYKQWLGIAYPKCTDSSDYRVEVYRLIPGITVTDLIRINGKPAQDRACYKHITSFDIITDMFLEYVIKSYYSTLTNDKVVFPNDNNISNFVITPKIANIKKVTADNVADVFVNIDYDHITTCSYQLMIHNVALQFFSFIYDTEIHPDNETLPWVVDFRNNNSLIDVIHSFKLRFYDRINDKESVASGLYDSFEHETWRFRNNPKLQNIVQEYNNKKKDNT